MPRPAPGMAMLGMPMFGMVGKPGIVRLKHSRGYKTSYVSCDQSGGTNINQKQFGIIITYNIYPVDTSRLEPSLSIHPLSLQKLHVCKTVYFPFSPPGMLGIPGRPPGRKPAASSGFSIGGLIPANKAAAGFIVAPPAPAQGFHEHYRVITLIQLVCFNDGMIKLIEIIVPHCFLILQYIKNLPNTS